MREIAQKVQEPTIPYVRDKFNIDIESSLDPKDLNKPSPARNSKYKSLSDN